MNCNIDQEKLALYAGGDLPEKEAAALRTHVEECHQCAALLDELIRVRNLAGAVIANKTPTPVPEDFTERVMAASGNEQSQRKTTRHYRYNITWLRIAAAAAILLAVFWTGRISKRVPDSPGGDRADMPPESPQTSVTVDGRFLRMLPVVGPFPVNEPPPVTSEGVYLILYRPQPDKAPDSFAVEYIGERTGPDGIDISREITCIMDRAVSRDNIFIVLYPMPASSTDQRQRVTQALIRTYKPICNDGV